MYLLRAGEGPVLLAQQLPMQPKYQDGAQFRWLNKKILGSKSLDDMEDISSWSFAGSGKMSLSDEHVKEGKHSLRISSLTEAAKVGNSGECRICSQRAGSQRKTGRRTTGFLSGFIRI